MVAHHGLEGILHLRQALDVLRNPPVAPELWEQVKTTLNELMPRIVIDLLELPLDEEHADFRSQGLELLREVSRLFGFQS